MLGALGHEASWQRLDLQTLGAQEPEVDQVEQQGHWAWAPGAGSQRPGDGQLLGVCKPGVGSQNPGAG